MKNTHPLQLRNLRKSFGRAEVLRGIDLDLQKGEIHALLGENGAGKSTLVKILTGVYKKDAGSIQINGKETEILSPWEAERQGIGVVHQDVTLVQGFTGMQNIWLGRELKGRLGVPDWKAMTKEVEKLAAASGIEVPFDVPASRLSLTEQQMICILRALMRQTTIFLLDEPTSAIALGETKRLFPIFKRLRAEGCSLMYISHRLDEVFELADRITVLRDGVVCFSSPKEETCLEDVINAITGARETSAVAQVEYEGGVSRLRVENLFAGQLANVSFTAKQGEILGFTGLPGSGLEELAAILYGVEQPTEGSLFVGERRFIFQSPKDALRAGVSMVPEDRRLKGLVLEMSVKENATLSSLQKFSNKIRLIKRELETAKITEMIKQLRIATPSQQFGTKLLSGGNQQKVVIAKSLLADSQVQIFHQPTEGVDVGARHEIANLIRQMANEGKAIILISTDVREVLDVSSRVLVLKEGRIVSELEAGEATEKEIRLISSGEVN